MALLVMLLAGCEGLGPAQPVVMVTRVPLDVADATALPADANPPLPELSERSPQPGELLTNAQHALAFEASEPAQSANALESATPPPILVGDPSLRTLQRTRNILLVGTDQRDLDTVGRTDSIMVLAIDAPNNRAALISFPRDLYIPIPGVGYSRINQAYVFGENRRAGAGLPLLMSTIERNFGIPIERYVRIDFSGFKGVIDALGGVDVEVDCPLSDELFIRFFQVYTLEPGTHHMTGEQALYYARSRMTTGDFDRSRRQQRVLLAIRDRILEGNLLPRIPALWLAMRDVVDTNLGASDITDLARLGASLGNNDLRGMVIRYPLVTDWTTPQGGMVQLPDLPAINSALDEVWERPPLMQDNEDARLCR